MSVGAAPGRVAQQLPAQASSFVGRLHDRAEIERVLRAARLVTLTGTGGVGKTRLALTVANTVAHDFRDGVRLVELAPVSEARVVPRVIASSLGILLGRHSAATDHLVAAMSRLNMLLVLDNCEHLVEACAEVAQALLRGCAEVKLLVTSREALRIDGEIAWHVPPLPVPDTGPTATPEEMLRVDAVRLFAERAWPSAPAEGAGNCWHAVARICRRLDGLPLAIELAAARVHGVGIAEIARRLDGELPDLGPGYRMAPARHQSLRAVLDWSYDLLSPQERELFVRLGVFAGGCDLAAAESVCSGGAIRPAAVADLLRSLVDKSLVVPEPLDGGLRYRLLETVRAYARMRQAEFESLPLDERHAEYFIAFAARADTQLLSAGQAEWLARLEHDHDNIRAALGWALLHGHPEHALQLAIVMQRFWARRGFLAEGGAWMQECLTQPGAERSPLWAEALVRAGRLAWLRGELPQATAWLEEGLAIHRARQDANGIAEGLSALALVMLSRGELARAIAYGDEAQVRFEQLGDVRAAAINLHNVACCWLLLGDTQRARPGLEHSLRVFRECGDADNIADGLLELGHLERRAGNRRLAQQRYAESLALARELDERRLIAVDLEGLAGLARCAGRFERAARLFGAADALLHVLGLPLQKSDRPNYDSDVEAVRAALGDHRCAAVWATGASQSLAETVSLALAEETASAPGERPPGPRLTRRERDVAALIAAGRTNREVATALVIAPATAERHVANILSKLGLRSRTEIALWVVEEPTRAEH